MRRVFLPLTNRHHTVRLVFRGRHGDVAHFGRAPVLHTGGSRFDSVLLHSFTRSSAAERLAVNQIVVGSIPTE